MFITNNYYDFETLAPAVLGAKYSTMRVLGTVVYSEATAVEDVATKHEAVKSIIPGLPATPNDLSYVIMEDPTGVRMVMAEAYIDINTIALVTTSDINIKVFGVNSSMELLITDMLRKLGNTSFEVTRL